MICVICMIWPEGAAASWPPHHDEGIHGDRSMPICLASCSTNRSRYSLLMTPKFLSEPHIGGVCEMDQEAAATVPSALPTPPALFASPRRDRRPPWAVDNVDEKSSHMAGPWRQRRHAQPNASQNEAQWLSRAPQELGQRRASPCLPGATQKGRSAHYGTRQDPEAVS